MRVFQPRHRPRQRFTQSAKRFPAKGHLEDIGDAFDILGGPSELLARKGSSPVHFPKCGNVETSPQIGIWISLEGTKFMINLKISFSSPVEGCTTVLPIDTENSSLNNRIRCARAGPQAA